MLGLVVPNLWDEIPLAGTGQPKDPFLLWMVRELLYQVWHMTPVALRLDQPRKSLPGRRYLPFAGAITVAYLVWLLFGDVLLSLVDDWWNVPAYSHGLLLPPFALYIAWLNRQRILARPAMYDARGIVVLAGACALLILGTAASEYFLMRVSFVVLLAGLVLTFQGEARLRALAFPLLLLLTMIPLPVIVYNALAAPLQLLASDVAFHVASAVGVSIFRDGNVLHLGGGALGVAEACSGLNSLSSLMVGSVLIGYLCCTSMWARIVVCCLSVPVAVAVNVFRVAGTAILSDYKFELAMGFYHTLSGWLVFVLGAGCLYVLASATEHIDMRWMRRA
jgi:exosortase